MAERVLRDHSEPCQHGRETCHDVAMAVVGHPEKVQLVPCPGGREVTIDHEVAQVDDMMSDLRLFRFGDELAAKHDAWIIELLTSGALVEAAIDYEWLCIELNHNIRRISNLPGNEGHCYFTSKPKHLTTCGRFGLVDAALPDRHV